MSVRVEQYYTCDGGCGREIDVRPNASTIYTLGRHLCTQCWNRFYGTAPRTGDENE